jgi:uncharacterized membrane protein
LRHHWHHHARFYVALALGLAAYAAARAFAWPVPAALGSDTFFLVFVLWSMVLAATLTGADLEKKADIEDEGGFIVTLIALAAIAYISFAIFTTLNADHRTLAQTLITLAGAPLM